MKENQIHRLATDRRSDMSNPVKKKKRPDKREVGGTLPQTAAKGVFLT